MKPLPPNTVPLNVVIRVRPLNNKEYKDGAKTIVHPADEKLIVLMDPHEDTDDILRANRSREKHYVFDHIFSMEATQEEVYYTAVEKRNIIENVLSGYNCTVFAYGATGAGKTYTMLGSDDEPGIMVHTLNNLFKKMEETKDETEYLVSMAYLEIYNECVRDLLCPDSGTLDLREDAGGSITVNNLLDISASSTDVILGMLRMGNTNRTSEPTVANKTSSRSHAILKVNVEQRDRVSRISQEVRCSSLYMVDLAGSERAAVTQNRGKRMIEGAHINRSLLALANCINALGSSNTNYINYRDSKLTRILKEALGGNCKTVMIAHISPTSISYEETRNTLVYAERSKKIKNKARMNVVDVDHHVTQYVQVIDDLNCQIARLRENLNKAVAGNDKSESVEVANLCEELKTFAIEQRDTRHKLLDLERHLLQNALECQKHLACVHDWEQKINSLELAAPSSPIFTPNSGHPVIDSPMLDPSDIDRSEATDLPAAINHCLCHTLLNKQPGSISLKQAGDVTSIPNLSSMLVTTDVQSDDCATTGEVSTGAGGSVFYRIPENFSVSHSIGPTRELVMSVSPDSGTTTVAGVNDQTEMEPLSVSTAREAIATLRAAKQRMEAQHKRLQEMLKEDKSSIEAIKEKLSYTNGFLPMRKEMIDLLQKNSNLEASKVEHSLSSVLMGIHVTQHASLVDQLLRHCASLLEVLEMHRVNFLEDGRIEIPDDPNQQFRILSDRQKRLVAQAKDLRTTPVLTEMELPSISRLSAKLYTRMTGSKSDLFIFGDDTDTASTGVHLPSTIPRSTIPSKAKKLRSDSPSRLCLPPLNLNHNPMVPPTTYPKKPSQDTSVKSSLNKSQISEILEAAKKSRDEKIVATLGSERLNRNKKKVMTKFTSLNSPRTSRASNKSKYIPSAANGGITTIIDLENNDIFSSTVTANTSTRLQSKSMMSLQHASKGSLHQKPTGNQRVKKSTSHISAERNSFSDLAGSNKQTKSFSSFGTMTEQKHSTPMFKGTATQKVDTVFFGSMSRPIVRKPVFAAQSGSIKNSTDSITLTRSVYSSKPFVIPMAHRISQHSPCRGKRGNKKRGGPLNQNSRVVKKSLPLRNVNRDDPFSFVASPYLSPSKPTGSRN